MTSDLPVTVYIGIGANLDGPVQQVSRALNELAALPRTRLVKKSSLYRTPPMGPPDQPDYINAVAELDTWLTPLALLDELQRIEQLHRRVRGAQRWGPRTLDLDLLLYGAQKIEQPRLRVPHPGLAERAFVLLPLVEIAPALAVPGLGALADLKASISSDGISCL